MVNGSAAHIAVILHDFGPGGTERIAVRLANLWAEAGRRVTIVCGSEKGPERASVAPGVTVVAAAPPIDRSPLSRLALGRFAAARLPELGADALFLPGNFHLPLARLLGPGAPPVMVKVSNPLLADIPAVARPAASVLLRWLAQPVACFAAMSETQAAEVRSLIGEGRSHILCDPLDMRMRAVSRPPRPAGAPARILWAGRIVPQKNLPLALRAFAALGDAGARLDVLGDGDGRADAEALAARLGIAASVTFHGHVAGIGPHLENADALLLSSVYEGVPAVALEALANLVPVAMTPCSPQLRDIVGKARAGQQAASADPALLAEALRQVLHDGPPDREAMAAELGMFEPARAAAAYLAAMDGMCG